MTTKVTKGDDSRPRLAAAVDGPNAGVSPSASGAGLQLLVQSVVDYAIFTLDTTGHITSWNAGAQQIKGYRAEEILGRHFSTFYPPQDVAAGKPDAELVVAAAEGRLEDEGWRVRKDGSRFWANVVITALFDDSRRLRGFSKVTRDMSERRAADQAVRASEGRFRQTSRALAAANEDLRRQAVELAAERDRSALANAEAQTATRAKSSFLATMSHEIRTPLNAVIGLTGLLMETPLTPEQRGFVETVHDSGDALLLLVNDILDFSKIESGKLVLESIPFDLRDCLENAVALVAHVADDRGLELVTQLSEGCPQTVVGDVNRFRQVIVNLLSNAVKFTAQGEVSVVCAGQQLSEVADGPVALTVSVRDTGAGIPQDRVGDLFQPFSQIDSSNTRLQGGTGLGLAISRRLAQAMGGDLDATSQPGVGSTFTFRAVLQGTGHRPASSAPGPLVGRRALVVDDNATSRQMLCRLLGGWGLSCSEASNGNEALALLSTNSYDVALLDLQMPDRNGLQLASDIRARPLGGGLRLILLTGLNPVREGGPQLANFAATVAKPVRSNVLHAKLLSTLSPATASAASESSSVGRRPETGGSRALRILVAEDNVVNQQVARLQLARLGHEVDIVDDGVQAVAAVHEVRYDVVLMDLQMPQMDGLEAARRIRAELAPDSQPYIVAMTANVFTEDRQASNEAGMDDYLSKPVRLLDLSAALSRVSSPGAVAPSPGHATP